MCICVPCALCAGGGPKRLRVLLEGESLLNDASGLTLFEVFFHIVSAETQQLQARATRACLLQASSLSRDTRDPAVAERMRNALGRMPITRHCTC
jgi:hypothetical protein